MSDLGKEKSEKAQNGFQINGFMSVDKNWKAEHVQSIDIKPITTFNIFESVQKYTVAQGMDVRKNLNEFYIY